MRKFRGQKLRANNEWVYGYYWYNPFTDEHFIKTLVEGGTQFEDVKVKPETVGSETTLKDKNGKEIYEGDICKKTYGSSTPVFTVAYHDARGMFIMQDGYNEPLYTVNNFMIEVIGNIYENPELTNKQN